MVVSNLLPELNKKDLKEEDEKHEDNLPHFDNKNEGDETTKGETFMIIIIEVDMWVLYYDPELRTSSKEYRHSSSVYAKNIRAKRWS